MYTFLEALDPLGRQNISINRAEMFYIDLSQETAFPHYYKVIGKNKKLFWAHSTVQAYETLMFYKNSLIAIPSESNSVEFNEIKF